MKTDSNAIPDVSSSNGPLRGIRVLDLSRLLPGPLTGMLLADMGADVIKIERPRDPDPVRHYPPFFQGRSAYDLALNRNKRSLALDTAQPDGKKLFLQLVEGADVVLESFRPGILDRAGMGYRDVSKRNPRIIYASLTGYGQDGPFAHMAGHDLNYMAYSGLLSMTCQENGHPVLPGWQLADIAGGSYPALAAILAALVERGVSGKGQHLDIALSDAVRPLAALAQAELEATGILETSRNRALSGALARYAIYETQDGKYMALAALEPKFWIAFCQAAGVPHWSTRMQPAPEEQQLLQTELEVLFKTRDQQEWVRLGEVADCCLSPVLDLTEVQMHPYHRYREAMPPALPAPGAGPGRTPVPVHFPGMKNGKMDTAPTLGQHTQDILDELLISPELRLEWERSGVIR